MKKFKSFFYPIYLVVIILVLLISFNIFESLELFKKWGFFRYFSDLPYMVRDLMIFLSVLMVTEIIVENIQLMGLRGRVAKLEKEVLNLKAKLYDQSETEKTQSDALLEEDTDVEEGDEDEDDDQ